MGLEISVIVPVLNDFRIQQCIESLLQQDLPRQKFELLIVDNGSNNPDLQTLIQTYPVRYIAEMHPGSYAARNRGIREANGNILVFTDADCIFPPQWLRIIYDHLHQGCCRICVGGSYSGDESFVPKCIQAVDDLRWQELSQQKYVQYADTRNLAALREIFQKDLFDETFQSAGDLDFGLTVTKRGERIHFLPELKVEHRHSNSLVASVQRGIRRGRGLAMMEQKHGSEVIISGARNWIVFGKDRKPTLLRMSRFFIFRYPMIIFAAMFIAITFCALSIARSFAACGLYYYLDRSSLLLGRLLG
jgi:glycosyltransferase involved in cell wall biosynthesis